jgi:hypothetical protein
LFLLIQYIVNAGVINELQELLIGNQNASSKQSLDVFGVQILGNLFIHERYAQLIPSYYSLCQWLVKTLSITRENELKTEVAITIRNILYQKIPIVSGYQTH